MTAREAANGGDAGHQTGAVTRGAAEKGGRVRMGQYIYHVDAFTKRPFAGNPAGVCLLDAPADEQWMLNVAREMNLSETAFLHRETDGYRLRWFTPAVEVDLCGHATLASAHVLWESGHLYASEPARFHTRSGLLSAQKLGEWIEMDFPATPPAEAEAPAELIAALGVSPLYVGKTRFDYVIELGSEAEIRAVAPDFAALGKVDARGVIVTSRAAEEDIDFVSRFFGPAVGVNEDPVTGSAHCSLTPFWAERLGKAEMAAYQASARGGEIHVQMAGDRVLLRGQAVTVMRGELV